MLSSAATRWLLYKEQVFPCMSFTRKIYFIITEKKERERKQVEWARIGTLRVINLSRSVYVYVIVRVYYVFNALLCGFCKCTE